MLYVYDFGDEWRHEVLLEDLPPQSQYRTDPICIDGENACPPEDIGGPFAYMDYLAMLRGDDEREAEYAHIILSRCFKPDRFDKNAVNRRLKLALLPERR